MKNMFTKLTDTLKAYKTVFITTATVIVIAILLTSFAACRSGNEQAPSQDVPTTTVSETVATDSTTVTNGEEATTATTTETQATTTTTKKKDTTTKKPVTSTSGKKTTTTTKKTTTTTKQNVVQAADPDTGVSWDGKSPIIYTYEDGTTGTEKKANATYEVAPGVIGSVPEPPAEDAPVFDGVHCMHCGKVGGDGSDGTCVRKLLIDECPLCHKTGIKGYCHTCAQ